MARLGLLINITARRGQRHVLVGQLLAAAAGVAGIEGLEGFVIHTSLAEADVAWVTVIWLGQAHYIVALSNPRLQRHIQDIRSLAAVRPEVIHTLPICGTFKESSS